MSTSEPSIFREKAIKSYQQRQEQGVMLRVSCPSGLAFFWVFLLILIGAMAFAWEVQVPIQFQSQGVVAQQGETIVALLFVPPGQQTSLRAGQPTTVSIGSTQFKISGSVASVSTTVVSPDEARARFDLQGGLAQIITEPSILVVISIGPAAANHIYAGSLCEAQIQVGSQSVLSALPGFNRLFGK